MTTFIFSRLICADGTAFDPVFMPSNNPVIIAPDIANDRIYTLYDFPSYTTQWLDFIFAHKASDGTAISANFVANICALSGNSYIQAPAFCLGTDDFLYAITTQGDPNLPGPWWDTGSVLSKINPATMLEVATITPYAVTNLLNTSDESAYRLIPFVLGGVNYIAIILSHNAVNNIEIINVDMMISIVQATYSTITFKMCPVAGDQSGTIQNIYFVQSVGGFTDHPQISKIAFNSIGPALATTIVRTFTPPDFDAGWTVGADAGVLMYAPDDNSLLFTVVNGPFGWQGSNPAYLMKVTAGAGTIAWQIGVPNAVTAQAYASSYQNLAGGRLIYVPTDIMPTSPLYTPAWGLGSVFLDITLATGAYIATPSPYTASIYRPSGLNGGSIMYPTLWDNVNNTLLFWVALSFTGGTYAYYDIPNWYGGWAQLNISSPSGELPARSIVPMPTPYYAWHGKTLGPRQEEDT